MVSLDSLLDTARQAGLSVAFEGERLLIRGPKSAGDVARVLAARKMELRSLFCDGQVLSTPAATAAPQKAVPDAWPDADIAAAADFALLLAPADLPAVPFEFRGPWCIVVDSERFLAALHSDIRRAPRCRRARAGALAADLAQLRAMLIADRPAPAVIVGSAIIESTAKIAAEATDLYPGP